MNKELLVDLFCGEKSIDKVAVLYDYECFTVDIDKQFNPTLCGDILDESIQDQIQVQLEKASVVWMSPDCRRWSLSAGNTYWTKYRMPKTLEVLDSIKMMLYCRYVADYCVKHGKIFFIENPNGRVVWILDNRYLKRVWYYQYGDTRAKPTNIWTNLDITFKTCSNSNKYCNHERAVRGSKTGTQGLKGSKERSVIPAELFHHIFRTISPQKSLEQIDDKIEVVH